MGLYEVNLQSGASVYVLAANKNNAVYKAYKKAIAKTESTPSNEGFKKWETAIVSVNIRYAMDLDETRFIIY